MTRAEDSAVAITIDIDWAPESAIEQTLNYFNQNNIPVTVFTTHDSLVLLERLDEVEVGLHPYFSSDSDHGNSITKAVDTVLSLPHNLKAYRSHRFITSNEIEEAMFGAGMRCSSNVCTNLEFVKPFYNRFNLLEVPIFLEDGGYLYNNRSLVIDPGLSRKIAEPGTKVVVVHPMHFVLNSPDWKFMVDIKRNTPRQQWQNFSSGELESTKCKTTGIRTFIENLVLEIRSQNVDFTTVGQIMRGSAK